MHPPDAPRLPSLEAFIAHLSDGIAVLDSHSAVQLVNPAGAVLLGTTPAHAQGKRILELVHPAADPAAQLAFREIERGAAVVDADLEVIRRDGTRVVLEVSARRLEASPGLVTLTFRDVTEPRKREAELRRARDFLERLIESSTDAIIASDMRGKIVVFNRAAEQLFGVTAAEARTLGVASLYPEGGAREIMRLLRESPDGKIEAVRTYGRTLGGDLMPIEVSASLLKVGGREHATVGLLRDLRERVRVEAELSMTRSRLLDAEKQSAVTALAGATAHELNQPLTVILGFVELLRRKIDPSHRSVLQSIADEAERMAQIVKKISRLTRVETVPYVGDRQIADLERSSEPPPVSQRRRSTPPPARDDGATPAPAAPVAKDR